MYIFFYLVFYILSTKYKKLPQIITENILFFISFFHNLLFLLFIKNKNKILKKTYKKFTDF
jgi:hypothetical protein